MDFEANNTQTSSSQSMGSGQSICTSLLGTLVQTVGDDLINVGSRYLEQNLDNWAQKL